MINYLLTMIHCQNMRFVLEKYTSVISKSCTTCSMIFKYLFHVWHEEIQWNYD